MPGTAVIDARIEKVLQGLRLGMTRRAASGFAGIGKSTFYRMLDDDGDGTFRDAVERAEAEAEATYTAVIAQAVPKNWQAAAWWLERRHPADFGRREAVEMTGKDGGPIDHRDVSGLADHERAALADAIRLHLRGQEEPARAAADASSD